jgi:uncharacterized protein YcnI
MIVRLCGAVLGGLLAVVLTTAGPAAAHITVDPRNAVQGGYATVVFRVPNERPEATITKVEIAFPEKNPVPGVRTKPVPGWKVKATERTVSPPIEVPGQQVDTVVSRLTWTPTSKQTAIAPDQFQEFPVSMGPLPKTSTLVFDATQKYSDGEVVKWTDQPTGGAVAEHPAPVLNLAKAPAPDGAATDVRNPAAPPDATDNSGSTPLWLSIVALVAGLLALAVGVLAYLRTRVGRGYADDAYDDEGDYDYDDDGDLADVEVDDADLADEAGLDREQDTPIRRPSPRPR